jgi:subtilisin family serine protease
MKKVTIISASIILLLLATAEAKDWYYYDLDSSQIELTLCDSLVTVLLDSTFLAGKSGPLDLSVPGLQEGYVPVPVDLDYYQYGVIPGYDLDVLLADLQALDEVDFATPTFQLTEESVWYVYHEFLVSFHEGVTQAQIDSVILVNALAVIREPGSYQPSYTFAQTENSPVDVFEICAGLFESGLCYTAFPNLYGLADLCLTPNDTYYPRQWHLNHTASFPGKVDADIDMAEAWEYAQGNTNTTIALIDYAFDIQHAHIDPQRFRFAFDSGGDFLKERQPDWEPSIPEGIVATHPLLWHGTACLGMVAAVANNSQGVAGIADSLAIMPIKTVDDELWGNFESYSLGFQWAAYWMVDVIFSAIDFPVGIPDIPRAIDYGYHYGGTATIIAAGNRSRRLNPLASLSTTFAVGGSDYDDNLWELSNRGPGLELLAPAVGITTTDVTGELGYNDHNMDSDSCNIDLDYYCNFGSGYTPINGSVYSGTSAAAAQVAAVAALVKSRRPGLTENPKSPEALYYVLRFSAEDQIHPSDPAGYDTLFGYGRLNAERALLAVVRGDANNDGTFNVSDAVHLIGYIFGGGAPPQPRLLTGDADGNGIVNVSDAVYLIGYIFGGGPPPAISFIYD